MSTQSTPATGWPTTRILFMLAGTLTLASAILAATVSPWYLLLAGAVGVNQLLLATTGFCPASYVIDRVRAGSSANA